MHREHALDAVDPAPAGPAAGPVPGPAFGGVTRWRPSAACWPVLGSGCPARSLTMTLAPRGPARRVGFLGVLRGEARDRHGHHEQGQDQSADGPEPGLRVVGQLPGGDQRGRAGWCAGPGPRRRPCEPWPAMTRPVMISSPPGEQRLDLFGCGRGAAVHGEVGELRRGRPPAGSPARPAAPWRGDPPGDAERGDFTRRSASRATTAAPTGTPIATTSTSGRLSARSLGRTALPVNGTSAIGIRTGTNRPNPAGRAAAAATADSTAAMTEICPRRARRPAAWRRSAAHDGRPTAGSPRDEDQHRESAGRGRPPRRSGHPVGPDSLVGRRSVQALWVLCRLLSAGTAVAIAADLLGVGLRAQFRGAVTDHDDQRVRDGNAAEPIVPVSWPG